MRSTMPSTKSARRGKTTRSGRTTSPLTPDLSKSITSLVFIDPSGFSLMMRATLLALAFGHLASTSSQFWNVSTNPRSAILDTSVSANLPSSV